MSHRKPHAEPDPEPWLRHLPPDLRDKPESVAWAKARHQSLEYEREFKQAIVDFYDLYKGCPYPVCQRAHRCANPAFPCFEDILPLLRKHFFPRLRKNAREAALQHGPRS